MTYGIKDSISEEELENAAERTGPLPLIQSLEQGFDANISISDNSVSGGQRQRIVLARELLKKSPYYCWMSPHRLWMLCPLWKYSKS